MTTKSKAMRDGRKMAAAAMGMIPASVRLEVRNTDGTTSVLPQTYTDMTDAWNDMLALQARHGEVNVRAVVIHDAR